jgi:thioredoxin 1
MAIVHINKQAFDEKILPSDAPVLVDFWADWCGPCKMLAPVLEQLSAAHPDLTIAKMNIDDDSSVAIEYGVTGIPTLILFQGGEAQKTVVGYRSLDELETLLDLK